MAVAPSELEQPPFRPNLHLVTAEPVRISDNEIGLQSFGRVILRHPDTSRMTGTRVLGLQPDWIRVSSSGRPERGHAEDKGAFPGIIAIVGDEIEIATAACIGLLHGRRFHLIPYRHGGDIVDKQPVEGSREILVSIKELHKIGQAAVHSAVKIA